MFDREVALYRVLRPHLANIAFVTYGDALDMRCADRLNGIRIICNRWRLPKWWYVSLVSKVYPLFWQGPAVLKSNQIQGAEVPLRVSRLYRKKFVARCGYLPSNIASWRHGSESVEAQKAQRLEAKVFEGADCIAVTTHMMKDTIARQYGVLDNKVKIVPNYVDTRVFQPAQDHRDPKLVCYVGRLEKEKNIQNLLLAMKGLDMELMVIGGGPLRDEMIKTAQSNGLAIRFVGNVPNASLPGYLNRSSLFVMPSHIEHHPKALLEAMACGLPVIGTEVPGIRELICHRETGYLCGTTPQEISGAIRDVLDDATLRARMGRNAREYVVENFDLNRIVEMELELLTDVVG